MNPQTLATVTTWLGLITMTIAVIGSVGMVATAVYQSLKSRTVRWDALVFAGLLLWAMPLGIRHYGPELVDATIDLLNNLAGKREPMEDAITRFIGETNEQLPIVPDVPAVIIATSEFTATPFPTPSVNFAATATAYFESEPTAVPPQPTVTLEPTRYVCRTIQDIQAGCTPPTPVPGN
jgi:hypothetical protein